MARNPFDQEPFGAGQYTGSIRDERAEVHRARMRTAADQVNQLAAGGDFRKAPWADEAFQQHVAIALQEGRKNKRVADALRTVGQALKGDE